VGVLLIRSVHDFLALTDPEEANVLVVEGWSPDYAVEAALAEFRSGSYEVLVASGGPMPLGTLVQGYGTYAEIAAASLRSLGLEGRHLLVAPAEPTLRHRTFHSAVGVRQALLERGLEFRGVNIVSVGTHARRSRDVYRKVLGDRCPVGVIAVPSQDYDPERWWGSSEGVKATVTEGLAWVYEKFSRGDADHAKE